MSRPDIVAAARAWIGTPYLHQGSARGVGTDCLGLLRGLWRETLGAEPAPIPAYTRDWSEAQGDERLLHAARLYLREVSPRMSAQGDVILFRMRHGAVAKHLGVQSAIGAAPAFIHAYTGHGVVESPLSRPWERRIAARFRFPSGD